MFNFCIIVIKSHCMRYTFNQPLRRQTLSSCLSRHVGETLEVWLPPLLIKLLQLLALTHFLSPLSQYPLRKWKEKGWSYKLQKIKEVIKTHLTQK